MRTFGIECFNYDFKAILARDAMSRKLRSWPLLSYDQINKIRNGFKLWPTACSCLDDHQCSGVVIKAQWECRNKRLSLDEITDKVSDDFNWFFPGVNELLNHPNFKGKIIAAGGAVFRAAIHESRNYKDTDIDLFFCAGQDVLFNGIAFLTDYWITNTQSKVRITRSEYVTTLYRINDRGAQSKIQFIHRLYASIDQVLGGFDLGPSMIGWDGNRFWTTELGAYSAFHQLIIVDTARRSTSFEFRINKYASYCDIIFPAMATISLNNVFANKIMPKAEMDLFVDEFFKQRGMILYWGAGKRESIDYWVLERLDDRKEALIVKLRQLAADHNFEIDWLQLTSTNGTGIVSTEERTALFRELNQYCNSVGWQFCDDSYHKERKLCETAMTFKMPYCSIQRLFTYSNQVVWRYRLNIDAVYDSTDYDSSEPWPHVVDGSDDLKFSDYDSINCSPDQTAYCNLTNIVAGRYDSVVATCAFQAPNFTSDSVYAESFIGERIFKVVSFKDIEANLASFFDDPYLGDLNNLLAYERAMVLDSVNNRPRRHRNWLFKLVLGKIPRGNSTTEWFHLVNHNGVQLLEFTIAYDKLIKDIEIKINNATERLKTLRWITHNPGRQYTSSINPIIEDPADWYGLAHTPIMLGNVKLESTMRLIHKIKAPDNDLAKLPKDVFKIILQLIMWNATLAN